MAGILRQAQDAFDGLSGALSQSKRAG